VLHCVSIVDEGVLMNHCPNANFYETLSMCAFLITALFLFVYWRYKTESLSVFIFPLIFVMTLVATLGNPVDAWTSPVIRNAWLDVHITLVLLGFAALAFTASASLPLPGHGVSARHGRMARAEPIVQCRDIPCE